MRIRTALMSAVAIAPLAFAGSAFAQSAGTSATGTSSGQTGTPGQTSPSSPGGMSKSGMSSPHRRQALICLGKRPPLVAFFSFECLSTPSRLPRLTKAAKPATVV